MKIVRITNLVIPSVNFNSGAIEIGKIVATGEQDQKGQGEKN